MTIKLLPLNNTTIVKFDFSVHHPFKKNVSECSENIQKQCLKNYKMEFMFLLTFTVAYYSMNNKKKKKHLKD